MSWEAVIGLEVHVQLRTERKLFCGNRVVFGDAPNTHVCPVCLGLPGALPTTNPQAVELALRTALALGCTVHLRSVWARKNYFYPDLPKGYQTTQFEEPIATAGLVAFDDADGVERVVRITRAHMEEDAGKSIHDRIPGNTAVDLNRAGTPLVEIVTEPDLRSAADARAFLVSLKQLLEYVDVSDCNMEEGSLRVDANVSVRTKGETELGAKTEIKNVNSFSGVEKAVEIEIARQIEVLEAGGSVEQETLLWDDHRGRLRSMRSKEDSHDYRYFPCPDLPPLVIEQAVVDAARAQLPELPRARRDRFTDAYGLSVYDAGVLTQSVATADYFEAVAAAAGDSKAAANWVMGPAQALMNERKEDATTFPVAAAALGELIGLVADGTVSDGAAKKVLTILAEDGGSPKAIVEAQGLTQVRDDDQLAGWVSEVVEELTDEVTRYREGETRLLGFLMGQVMKRSGGKADPRRVNELLRDALGS
ncbi:MAG: Asp-tRNA(Asn)/Glu-tRNA(Gln) amidotransferase subunit GatB [Gemmatimonadota bacterium]|nr:Asp-tRNA(Asn)/Glu-tRNA(Gln) amidotransferase subunit GatB [Gemmatimonadota bacterium]MDH3421558.1 Asp-tRNA(Asn)/Glu-tRNA(Gln) amidotransferase subunit GatB [Gemmatimonadota bacterium]